MKLFKFLIVTSFLFTACQSLAQQPINWTADQLMEPSKLAEAIKKNKSLPVIYSIGPGPVIPNSIDIGMVKDAENLKKLKEELTGISKDSSIVIYCGCCPFDHCPNVRPAIALLKEMKFTNFKLLNLPHNIKIDWIDKGYPGN